MPYSLRRWMTRAAGILLLFIWATPALAQLSVATPSHNIYRWNTVVNKYFAAYDSVNQIYLAVFDGVSDHPQARATFVNKDGVAIYGPFYITDPDEYAGWTRVEFGGPPDKPRFLFTYTVLNGTTNPRRMRLIDWNGGSPRVGPATLLNNMAGDWFNSDQSQAVWTGAHFLVPWKSSAGTAFPNSYVAAFDITGTDGLSLTYAGVMGALGDGVSDYYSDPGGLACDPSSGVCLAAGWAVGVPFGPQPPGTWNGGSWARLFSASTLAPLGGIFYLDSPAPNVGNLHRCEDQRVAFNKKMGRFDTAYVRDGNYIDLRGVATNGTVGPLDYTKSLGPHLGQIQLVYNDGTQTTLLAVKDWANVYGVELNDDGYYNDPGNVRIVTVSIPGYIDTGGDWGSATFYPMAAANGADSQWLVGYASQSVAGRAAIVAGTPAAPPLPPPTGWSFGKMAPASGRTGLATNVTLSWPYIAGVGYEVCVDTVNNGTCDTSWVSTGTQASYALTGLAQGTYYWQVRGNATTYADGGTWWSFTVGDVPPPLPVTWSFGKLSPVTGASGLGTSVTMGWVSVPGVTYEVCIDTSDNNTCDTSWQSMGSATTATATGLAPGAYYWQVRGTGMTTLGTSSTVAANNGTWWSFWVGSVLLPPTWSFGKVSPSSGHPDVGTAPVLSWVSVPGVTYEVCVDTTNNNTCDTSWHSAGTAATYALSGLTPGTYYWQVRGTGTTTGGPVTTSADRDTWWSFLVGSGSLPPTWSFGKLSPSSGHPDVGTGPVLSWVSVPGVTYEVCVDTTNNGTCDTSWQSVGAANNYALSGLAAGTYYWQVRGTGMTSLGTSSTVNADNGTWWSFLVGSSALPPTWSFGKLSPTNGHPDMGTSAVLSWVSVPGVTYEVCVDTTNNSTCDTTWQSAGTATTYALSGLTAGSTYYWQVRGTGTTTGGPVTTAADHDTWWSFTVAGGSLPPTWSFGKLTPRNGIVGIGSSITLSWVAVDGVTYEYCVDVTNTCSSSSWQSTGAAASAAVTGLAPGTYYWQVRGNGTTEADRGAWWTFVVGSPSLPSGWSFGKLAPGDGSSGLSSSVTLSWVGVAGVNYQVCVDVTNTCVTRWQSTGTATTLDLTGLAAGTYYWQVRGNETEADRGAWWSFTVGAPPSSSLPPGWSFGKLAPVNGGSGPGGSVTLSWVGVPGVNYQVCIDTTANNTCDSFWQSTGAGTTLSLTGLAPGTYYWQVRGNGNDADRGTWWSWTVTTPPASVTGARDLISVVDDGVSFTKQAPAHGDMSLGDSVALNWTGIEGANYWVCITTTAGGACDTAWRLTGHATSVELSGLAPGTYYWQVRAETEAGTVQADTGMWYVLIVGGSPTLSFEAPGEPDAAPAMQ